jgi:hypothetical protein
MTFSGGGTPRQLAARAFFKDLSRVNPTFDRLANESIDFDYKLRPDSSFSQDNLDRFNKRQDEARRQFAQLYGSENLRDITRYDRLEDIPRYTQEDIRQMNIERLKANPKSYYNRKNTPLNTNFDRPNQKVPQAVVDSYNALTGKFRNLRDTGDQSSVGRQDFQNVLNSLRDSPAEYIQPGEEYLGPAFENVDGSLLRDDPSSIFFTEKVKEKQAEAAAKASGFSDPETAFSAAAPVPTRRPALAAPFVSETRETGRAREIGMPMPSRIPGVVEPESPFAARPEPILARDEPDAPFVESEVPFVESEVPFVERPDPSLDFKARRALRLERRADRREARKSGRADRVKARKAARMARRFQRMQNR